jgi:hypothetical protein
MDRVIFYHYTLGCILHTLYGTEVNICATPLATRPKYLAKIANNEHFRVYLGSGCSGTQWVLRFLTIIHLDASSTPYMAVRRIFVPLPQHPDPNTLLKSRKMAVQGIQGRVTQEVNGF